MSDPSPSQTSRAVRPVSELDFLIARLGAWIREKESELARVVEEPETPTIPDDIPRFVTRYPE